MRIFRQIARSILNAGPSWLCKWEYEHQDFLRLNERPVEFAFVFRKIAECCPVTILDVGTGRTALPYMMRNGGSMVTAIDNIHDYWQYGMGNRHYHVIDDDITATRLTESFDMITCISVLEHIVKHEAAMRNMFSLLKPEGHLILTFPYQERKYVQNVYKLPGSSYGQDAPFITQSYSRAELQRWLEDNNGTVVEQEFWRFWEGEHWTVGNQIIPGERVEADDKHQLTCLHLRKRG